MSVLARPGEQNGVRWATCVQVTPRDGAVAEHQPVGGEGAGGPEPRPPGLPGQATMSPSPLGRCPLKLSRFLV